MAADGPRVGLFGGLLRLPDGYFLVVDTTAQFTHVFYRGIPSIVGTITIGPLSELPAPEESPIQWKHERRETRDGVTVDTYVVGPNSPRQNTSNKDSVLVVLRDSKHFMSVLDPDKAAWRSILNSLSQYRVE